jgi:ribosomal protein S18 acetylase RimI-like enzyme
LDTYPNTAVGISREDIEDSFRDRYSAAKLGALEERLGGSLQTDVTFVARSSVRIIGVCRAMRHDDRKELRSLYVLKEYIGRGVGSQMWSTARDFLDKKQATFVEVAAYNEPAILFYRRHGFAGVQAILSSKIKFKSGAVMPLLQMRRDAIVATHEHR